MTAESAESLLRIRLTRSRCVLHTVMTTASSCTSNLVKYDGL